MPCDPRLWTEHPIESTYPACIAVIAAREQGFEIALGSHASVEAFGADIDEVRDIPQEARAAGRLSKTEGKERLSMPSAVCAELWKLAAEWKLRPIRALTGTIWEAA